jgi:hypothetical protein
MDKSILRKATLAAMLAGAMTSTGVAQTTDPMRERLERLAEPQLKAAYLRCAREAEIRRLDGCEIAVCSMGRDVLLKKAFAGDFDSLLAWSRTQQTKAPGGVGRGVPLCDD